jgi:hypothetical protein
LIRLQWKIADLKVRNSIVIGYTSFPHEQLYTIYLLCRLFYLRTELLAQYNIFTNMVTCDGVKISLPRFEVLPLDPLVKTTYQLTQQSLVNLTNTSYNVSFISNTTKFLGSGC